LSLRWQPKVAPATIGKTRTCVALWDMGGVVWVLEWTPSTACGTQETSCALRRRLEKS
ncbi:unnamed protein product, partial [Musa hybrid cultivar]